MGLRREVLVTGRLEVSLVTGGMRSSGICGTDGRVMMHSSPLFRCRAAVVREFSMP